MGVGKQKTMDVKKEASPQKPNGKKGLGRRAFIQKSLACSGTLLGGFSLTQAFGFSAKGKKPPNILFLLVDQWRGQALSCSGDPNIKTTNIDQLAASGLRLTQCYSNSPLCTPYRAMLMSGRYPARTKVYTNNALLAPEEYSLADHFVRAGYATGYVGKWHLDGAHRGHVKHRQGWEYFAGFNRGHNYFDGEYWINESSQKNRIPKGTFEPDVQANLAMEWIRETTRTQPDKPWFMMISWGGPHGPYIAPDSYMNQFDPNTLEMRPNVECHVEKSCSTDSRYDLEMCSPCEKTMRTKLQGYYAHAKNLDNNTGRLMAFLKQNGMEQNTIVIFTSDHGDMHFSNGFETKGKPWEESINVPFVVRWPGRIPEATVSDALLSGIDLYPTLCGLAGLPVPHGKDGQDLSALLCGTGGQEQDSIFITRGPQDWGWRGVRTKRYSYAWYWGEKAEERDFGIWAERQYGGPGSERPLLLYDNLEDPFQLRNLAIEEAYRPLLRELHGLTLAHMRRMADPMTSLLESAVI